MMLDVLKTVAITETMLHMRDTMRSLWGDQFTEKLAPWQSAITTVAERKHVDPLQAAIQLAKAADGGHAVLPIMAAYVEMVEPSARSATPITTQGITP